MSEITLESKNCQSVSTSVTEKRNISLIEVSIYIVLLVLLLCLDFLC